MKIKPLYQLLLLFFFTMGAYYPTLFAPFNTLDDELLVQQLLNQEGFFLSRHLSPGGTYDYFRPLLTLTFEVDKYVGGLQETFSHLLNVLIHAFNVVLVFQLARRFGSFAGRESHWLPFLGALLFALHPINTEAVNWIVGRTDLLAGTFVFASLYCLLRCVESRSLLWGAGGAIALLLGALCKETALFLVPGACFLLVCRSVSGPSGWRLRWVLPGFYALAVAGYFVLRWGAFQTDRGLSHTAQLVVRAAGVSALQQAAEASDPFPWLDAFRVVLKASGFYAAKLLQPLPLNFAIYRIDPMFLLPGVALVIALVVLVWRRRLDGWLFLVSASIAVSALFVVFTQLAWTPIAERYMYIPSAPFAIALVFGLDGMLTSPAWRKGAMLIIPLLAGAAFWSTASRNIVWQDNLSLYQDTVRKSPDFAPAKNQLALALYAHNRADEARTMMAQNKMPEGGAAALNRAVAYWEEGDYEAARADLLQRLENSGEQKIQILEMLIRMTTARALEVSDEEVKRIYYEDILSWLERIRAMAPSGFLSYRIGRVHLILNNRMEAQRAFADADRQLPPDSLYKEPAAKLARNLAL